MGDAFVCCGQYIQLSAGVQLRERSLAHIWDVLDAFRYAGLGSHPQDRRIGGIRTDDEQLVGQVNRSPHSGERPDQVWHITPLRQLADKKDIGHRSAKDADDFSGDLFGAVAPEIAVMRRGINDIDGGWRQMKMTYQIILR